jgi:DNA-binding transcriptional regulator GbsR (MarR family)
MGKNDIKEARERLIDAGGRTTQDFGMGRVLGQVMAFLYLTDGEVSLDGIGAGLALSKAAVSVATRQLENLGLVRRVWKSGDKRRYYRVVDNFAVALQRGILGMMREKLRAGEEDLAFAEEKISTVESSDEVEFLKGRLERARNMRDRIDALINNPFVKMIGSG